MNDIYGITKWIVLASAFAVSVKGDTCSYYDVFDNYQSFNCPRYSDFSDEDYCCGSGSTQRCCDYATKYGKELTPIGSIIGGVFTFLVIVGVVIALVICCCVASCPLYQRRYRGRVINRGVAGTVVVSQTQQMTGNVIHHPPTVTYAQPAPHYGYGAQPKYGGPTNLPLNQYGGHTNPPPPNVYGGQVNPAFSSQPAPYAQQQQTSIAGGNGGMPAPPNYSQATGQGPIATVDPAYPPVN